MPLKENLSQIRSRVNDICEDKGFDQKSVKIIAVSKTKPSSEIKDLCTYGHLDFGENYVQEWKQKYIELQEQNIIWHFIGHLQSNKAKEVVGYVKYIHSLHSLKLAKKIDTLAQSQNIIQKCFLQINLSEETSKSGILENEIDDVISNLNLLEHIKIVGLMTMPQASQYPEESRPIFKKLNEIKKRLNEEKKYKEFIPFLSMGMSQDFEIAIEEGATHIRVGSLIFGERNYTSKKITLS